MARARSLFLARTAHAIDHPADLTSSLPLCFFGRLLSRVDYMFLKACLLTETCLIHSSFPSFQASPTLVLYLPPTPPCQVLSVSPLPLSSTYVIKLAQAVCALSHTQVYTLFLYTHICDKKNCVRSVKLSNMSTFS